jgi:hypothetical protein
MNNKQGKAMDYSTEPDYLNSYLATTSRDWTYSLDRIKGLATHWKELSEGHLQKGVEISFTENPLQINGTVFGKRFLIHINPLVVDGKGFAEAILTVNTLGKTELELDRFIMDRNGNISTADGRLLITENDNAPSYRTLASILHTVLEAPQALKS